MFQKLQAFLKGRATLDSKVFFIVLIVGGLTTFASAIFTFVENLGIGATVSTFCCFLLLVCLFVVSFLFQKEAVCHILLCVILNFIFLPVTFFFCGGLRSGMILYYLTALYIIVPSIPQKKVRMIIFITSLFALCVSIYLSTHVIPQYVVEVTDHAWHLDAIMSLVLNAICIYFISNLVVRSYMIERQEKEGLLEKLRELSKRDELTGLYNRREMFAHLEGQAADPNRYLMMFDVDNFKKVNDTYGHVFGDKVLASIAACMKEHIHESRGELAARYGGEEFVCLFQESRSDVAFQRADALRMAIYDIVYEEYPQMHISISAGLTACQQNRAVRETLKAADELLYEAKENGKNQVVQSRTESVAGTA